MIFCVKIIPDNYSARECVESLDLSEPLNQKSYVAIKRLWKDPGIQTAWRHRADRQVCLPVFCLRLIDMIELMLSGASQRGFIFKKTTYGSELRHLCD